MFAFSGPFGPSAVVVVGGLADAFESAAPGFATGSVLKTTPEAACLLAHASFEAMSLFESLQATRAFRPAFPVFLPTPPSHSLAHPILTSMCAAAWLQNNLQNGGKIQKHSFQNSFRCRKRVFIDVGLQHRSMFIRQIRQPPPGGDKACEK